MFRAYSQKQMMLLPPSLSDFLSETHPAHMISDLVEKLELSALIARYGPMGQPAYHPKLMLKIILYGFTVGIFSSRKLKRACEENLAFKYLAGMETPAFKTFIEFRRRHRDDMKAVFVETVKLAKELGLMKLGGVAFDGSKIEANTSKHKAMSYGRMQEEEKRLRDEIEGLLKQADETDAREDQENGSDDDGYSLKDELGRRESRLKKIEAAKAALEEREKKTDPDKPVDPKKQISFADKDARCHAKKADGTKYVYNAQAAVDMETQIIVENHIEDSVQDARAVKPALENMKRDLGQLPETLVADAGYGNQETLKSCKEAGVTPVCATAREGKEEKETPKIDAFDYDGVGDRFACPHGQTFAFDHARATDGKRTYRSVDAIVCGCGNSRTADGKGVLLVWPSHLAKRELKRIMEEPGHRELYRRRKCTVEPVFGQIKAGMGFRRFFYRGREKVGSEWSLVCAAFNIQKVANLIRNVGGLAAMTARNDENAAFRSFWSKLCAYVVRLHKWMATLDAHVAPSLQYG